MGVLQNEPKKDDLQLTAVLHALSDDTRLQIVQSLAATDDIACSYFDIHMPKTSLSHHFRVLRASGVITTRKQGTSRLNRLRRDDLEERFPGVLNSVLASTAIVSMESEPRQEEKPRDAAKPKKARGLR